MAASASPMLNRGQSIGPSVKHRLEDYGSCRKRLRIDRCATAAMVSPHSQEGFLSMKSALILRDLAPEISYSLEEKRDSCHCLTPS